MCGLTFFPPLLLLEDQGNVPTREINDRAERGSFVLPTDSVTVFRFLLFFFFIGMPVWCSDTISVFSLFLFLHVC